MALHHPKARIRGWPGSRRRQRRPGRSRSGPWQHAGGCRLQPPRPSFAMEMSDRQAGGNAAAHGALAVRDRCRPDGGLRTGGGRFGSWGLAVVESEDEEELRTFAAQDPVVTTRTATL